jgi:hypothetical protein
LFIGASVPQKDVLLGTKALLDSNGPIELQEVKDERRG